MAENEKHEYFHVKPANPYARFLSPQYWLDFITNKYAFRWSLFVFLVFFYYFRV